MAESESLEWWLDWVNVLIGTMADANLRGVVDLDYSQASLQPLEDFVRQRYRGRYPLGDDPFTAGVAAYLGETLMRVAGGAWDWTTEPLPNDGPAEQDSPRDLAHHQWHVSGQDEPDAVGLPIVRPDPATGLPPLSPVHLVLDAVEGADGAVWTATWQRWRDAVQAHAAAHPGWAPSKQHTLADGVISSPPASAQLDDWLAAQREHFAEWADRYPGEWDHSPESIDRLAALVAERTPTVADFYDRANADFVDGASYYLGETLRRGTPCRWVYRRFPFNRSDGAPVTADFHIQKNDNSDFTGPFDVLVYTLELSDPGKARDFYGRWTAAAGQQ
ncbi:hypothetical protein A5714_17360 [Mycobacterium sp. E2462]|uniref:hypothetical protein n=1 Tax=Mycobacterium sp. E2462 TaxID=1834133 RepID=UPI0007FE6215|nr:hypothetical protein [Mycobacterium sp. E2462]OBI10807.1 hypothetical protein A5714_17360 [Mycobacterium sp. E2462]